MSEKLNIDEEIKIIDKSIEDQEWLIARGEALERLKQSEDFELVFGEGYLQYEADRVFNLLVHPLVVKPEDKESYLSQLDTIKNVGRYIGTPEYKGTIAIQAINAKQAKEEMIAKKQELLAGKAE